MCCFNIFLYQFFVYVRNFNTSTLSIYYCLRKGIDVFAMNINFYDNKNCEFCLLSDTLVLMYELLSN